VATTILPAAGYSDNNARTEGEMKIVFEDIIAKVKEGPGGNLPSNLTISGGIITPNKGFHTYSVSAEASADFDEVDTISVTNHANGSIVYIKAAPFGGALHFRHAQGGTGQLIFPSTMQEGKVVFEASAPNTVDYVRFLLGPGNDWSYMDHVHQFEVISAHGTTSGRIATGADIDFTSMKHDPYVDSGTPGYDGVNRDRINLGPGISRARVHFGVDFNDNGDATYLQLQLIANGLPSDAHLVSDTKHVTSAMPDIGFSGSTGELEVTEGDYFKLRAIHDGSVTDPQLDSTQTKTWIEIEEIS